MANLLDIRNPNDLTSTYDQIEIKRDTLSTMATESTLATVSIVTTNASDLSVGFTSYNDSTGDSTHYYRFRYKISGSGSYSNYSDIFQATTTVMHNRFRRRTRDTNSANYYFTNDDITNFLANAIRKLYPYTYNEVIDESLTTESTTEKFSFPTGVTRITKIQFIDSSGNVVSSSSGYSLRARQIIFDSAPSSGYTFRLYCEKMYQKLAEVPEIFDDLILDLMILEAWQTFEIDRSRYARYTTMVNPEGGNIPSIRSVIERTQIATEKRLNSLRRTRRAANIKLT